MRKTTILKSMLLAVVLTLGSINLWADNATYTVIDYANTSFTTSDGFFSITTEKSDGQTPPAYNSTAADLRIYAKGTLTITPEEGKTITAISFEISSQGKKRISGTNTVDVGTITTTATTCTWAGSTTAPITIKVGEYATLGSDGATKAGQLCFTAMTIEYSGGSSTPTVSTPTITPATGTYYSTQSVSISSSTADATIYYTTDGSTPDDTKTVYSAPFDVASTTTVNAIAYKAGMNASGIASTTITIETAPSTTGDGSQQNPFTIGDVKTMNRQTSDGNKYWVKGYIVGVVAGGNNEGNISSLENPVKGVSNLALADAADATDLTTMIAVQLPTEAQAPGVRAALNLLDNQTNLGKLVFVYGTLEKYFGAVPGVKNITEFAWDSTTGINKTQTLNSWSNGNTIYLNATAGESIEVYNIAGQKIISKTANEGINSINHNEKGVVIVKAGSRVSKLVIR